MGPSKARASPFSVRVTAVCMSEVWASECDEPRNPAAHDKGRGWTDTHAYATRNDMSQTTTPPLVAVLNGPNMNMLGLRQPELYGSATLDDVEQICAEAADQLGLAIDFRQTNGEGELVSWVQECRGRAQGIVINPAGYTTTSIALMDALLASDLPVIEVHVTNIHRREEFRQHSYVSKAAVGVICGLGVRGYALALTAMADLLLEDNT